MTNRRVFFCGKCKWSYEFSTSSVIDKQKPDLLIKTKISSNTRLVFPFRETDHVYEVTEKCLVIMNLPSLLASSIFNDINKLIHDIFGKVLTKPCKMLEKIVSQMYMKTKSWGFNSLSHAMAAMKNGKF